MSKMSELYEAKEIIERLGGQVMMPESRDDEVSRWLGEALRFLKLARDAVNEGGSYRHSSTVNIETARVLLATIEASWVQTEKQEAA